MKSKLIRRIERTPIGHRLLKDHRFRLILFTVLNMGWNLFYAVFNGILGIVYRSGWFGTMCAYYAVLGLMKLNIVLSERKKPSAGTERRNMLETGIGLLFLAAIFALIVALTIADAVGRNYHIIVMIGIATFTFFMVGKAVVSAVQAHRQGDRVSIMLRNISLASAVGSILSLERSMLGTFSTSTDPFTFVMEGVSGLAGFAIVVLLGGSMITYFVKSRREHEG